MTDNPLVAKLEAAHATGNELAIRQLEARLEEHDAKPTPAPTADGDVETLKTHAAATSETLTKQGEGLSSVATRLDNLENLLESIRTELAATATAVEAQGKRLEQLEAPAPAPDTSQ